MCACVCVRGEREREKERERKSAGARARERETTAQIGKAAETSVTKKKICMLVRRHAIKIWTKDIESSSRCGMR